MNKLDYSNFDSTNADIAFSAVNGYNNPASEELARKQLSYPLKEIKTFLGNTMPVKGSEVVQLEVSNDNKLSYRTTPNGDLTEISGFSIDMVYPVGSIYMSVNSANPSTLFTGTTWEQIKDTFLLSAGDTYSGGATGGEATHTLTVDEIPEHSHSYTRYNTKLSGTAAGSVGDPWSGNTTTTSGNAGGGNAHNNMPPYLVVWMWKRVS